MIKLCQLLEPNMTNLTRRSDVPTDSQTHHRLSALIYVSLLVGVTRVDELGVLAAG